MGKYALNASDIHHQAIFVTRRLSLWPQVICGFTVIAYQCELEFWWSHKDLLLGDWVDWWSHMMKPKECWHRTLRTIQACLAVQCPPSTGWGDHLPMYNVNYKTKKWCWCWPLFNSWLRVGGHERHLREPFATNSDFTQHHTTGHIATAMTARITARPFPNLNQKKRATL